MESVLQIARSYAVRGFSVIPILPNAMKKPACKWKEFQARIASEQDLARMFLAGMGVGIICGTVSGNLEVLDFDDLPSFKKFSVELQRLRPGLLDALPIVATPDNGRHVYIRATHAVCGNTLLAGSQSGVLIETRGEGGYVLAPGCPPGCHPSGGVYELLDGPDFHQGESVSLEDLELIHGVARSQDERPRDSGPDGRPGDVCNDRMSWEEILVPYG